MKITFRKHFFLLSTMAIVLAGCVSFTPNTPNFEAASIPEKGVEVTRGVGDFLLTQGQATKIESVFIKKIQNGGLVTPGLYQLTGKLDWFKIYLPVKGTGALLKDNDNPRWKGITSFFLAYNTKNNVLRYTGYNGFGGVPPALASNGFDIDLNDYEIKEASVFAENSFQQSLIYTGKEKNVIRLSYREFSNDMARPAFTVDLTYDLSESDIIAFRTARLKILSATNTEIKYIVLENFK